MFAGGIADKLGNRYEAKWLVRQLLDVIGGKSTSLRYEGISADFHGFEFSIRKGDVVEWHQTKISNPNGNWTLNALKREGVLSAFKSRLSFNDRNHCVFISQDAAKDIGTLAEKAKVANSSKEYKESLGKGHKEKLNELLKDWEVNDEVAFSWLRRCDFRTESNAAIDSAISSFSDLYFLNAYDTSFEILREFLEQRINKEITTERAKYDIHLEGKLTLKAWSLDPTLRERLSAETASYLETYTPFGAGGSAISRSEAHNLTRLIEDSAGPSVILLTGVAGSGKSGVIREFIGQLEEMDICHLALRIDQHLDCTSPRALGKVVTGREETPVATLKGLTPNQTSVFIVDQVDAVSEVSGRNGAVKQAILRLVDDVRNFRSVRLVIVCRTFDLESDERLKALKDAFGVGHVDVPILSWTDTVEPLLASKSVDVNQLSEKQRDLLCLPLTLSIFLETLDGTAPLFTSRNDLFARLLEKKGRSIRVDRQLTWGVISPLSRLAEWMSEQQRLDAPEDIIDDFSGALDILSSEGLIIRSRGNINFFHESFFDYVYARTFTSRQQSLESLLLSSEQHLFRRTQIRQILETLRQTDKPRYFQELLTVLSSEGVRYHVKVAIAQWLGSLFDPLKDEKDIVFTLDTMTGPFPQLVRYALLASPGWFERLLQDGWILTNLQGNIPERTETILLWLSNIAGQHPTEIAELLDRWWENDADRGGGLLDWFGFVRRGRLDAALINLCSRLIRSCPPGLFEGKQLNRRDLLLRTWAGGNPKGASEILKAYFEAWFDAHPGQHPFERDEFRDLDMHSLDEMAKKAPKAFVDGSIDAFTRSVDLIVQKETNGEWDSSFRHRAYSGHHFGADAFLSSFRTALRDIASKEPDVAGELLRRTDPVKHEVLTHIWLETIAANGSALCDLLPELLKSPHLFDAGWDGADWKSFADAAKEAIPYMTRENAALVERTIFSYQSELRYASELTARLKLEGESEPWLNRQNVIWYLNRAGHEQWCVLENIADTHLTDVARQRLAQLRNKFKKLAIPEPRHNEAHCVGSPIKRDKTARMTDAHWLRAIECYKNDENWRHGRKFIDGGARQLSGELQHLAKEQPIRFAHFLDQIPDHAHQTYVSHILWGLAEVDELDDDTLRLAILNAHSRPKQPYGSDIARLLEKHPRIAADPIIFDILTWYIEHGDANDEDVVDSKNTERELVTIDDLMDSAGHLHIRGVNGARGWAAEALYDVLWQVPEKTEKAWTILERRAVEEPLVSVRCGLMRPIVPLYNHDRQRCAALAERLSRAPTDAMATHGSAVFERTWLRLAFPYKRLPNVAKRLSASSAKFLDNFVRWSRANLGDYTESKWLSPLLTHEGTYLLSFLLNSVPMVGRRLIYRLLVCGDETFRMIGAWHIFRLSFQDAGYAPLADNLVQDGVIYRRLATAVAADAVTHDEYRYRAEIVLQNGFDDDDQKVRRLAADVFRKIKPNEFLKYRWLADKYLDSRAFEADSFAFFHALEKAECRVDDIAISAAEKLIADIERDINLAGRRSMDLHQLQDIIKKEYASSESDPELRCRLLDLIDKMLSLELYGTDEIVKAHER